MIFVSHRSTDGRGRCNFCFPKKQDFDIFWDSNCSSEPNSMYSHFFSYDALLAVLRSIIVPRSPPQPSSPKALKRLKRHALSG